MQRVACIDIGTVTGRLAVADVEGGHVVRLAKQTTICDLGEGLSATGRLSDAAIGRVAACVEGYLTAARAARAPLACCTLTSAARDASNSDTLLDALKKRGLEPQVIHGEIEGRLTFLGVAQDFAGEAILVADNGGGSTELALGKLGERGLDLAFVRSFDVGCRRVTERFLSDGKEGVPTEEGLARAHAFAAEYFAQAVDLLAAAPLTPARLVACGGTVTSLVAMDAQLVPYDSRFVHLHELTREQVDRLERKLVPMTVGERAQLPGLQPKRAHVILGGVVAIAELMEQTGFDVLTVSESDLLFGLSLAAAAAAAGKSVIGGWQPALAALA